MASHELKEVGVTGGPNAPIRVAWLRPLFRRSETVQSYNTLAEARICLVSTLLITVHFSKWTVRYDQWPFRRIIDLFLPDWIPDR
ncbi:hypothetical protein Y032_0090g2329 [Ancylostoma ceylanicum]|uniref:Uncharacterized protein n=1 Tax=Ancylostoma ceylanicum TaxID=53326 RepID=A0A016TMJ2_9BILA|nr:hypothetical protein Y032_0090g2329 [Ancylostoma ceylanicum]